jgi:hypothetical protein
MTAVKHIQVKETAYTYNKGKWPKSQKELWIAINILIVECGQESSETSFKYN